MEFMTLALYFWQDHVSVTAKKFKPSERSTQQFDTDYHHRSSICILKKCTKFQTTKINELTPSQNSPTIKCLITFMKRDYCKIQFFCFTTPGKKGNNYWCLEDCFASKTLVSMKSHPRTLESSGILLSEPQTSQRDGFFKNKWQGNRTVSVWISL